MADGEIIGEAIANLEVFREYEPQRHKVHKEKQECDRCLICKASVSFLELWVKLSANFDESRTVS